MTDPIPATAEDVLAFFQRQREEERKKIIDGVNREKFTPRQIRRMAGRIRFTVGGKPCLKPTAGRLYDARAKLMATAKELRAVDPRRIINAVAIDCRLEPLTVAKFWPEIAASLQNG